MCPLHAGDAPFCTPEQYKECAEPALGEYQEIYPWVQWVSQAEGTSSSLRPPGWQDWGALEQLQPSDGF